MELGGSEEVNIAKRRERNESAGKPQVCFFWDIENVHVPTGTNPRAIAMKLRNTFVKDGFSEYDFYAACDCKRERKQLLDALNDAEISVLHTDGFKKNSADSKLRSKMRRVATQMKEDDKIVLITSDNDFAPEVREIRYTHLLTMVLVHNPVVSTALIHFTHEHYSFLDLVKDILVDNPEFGVNAKNFPEICDQVKSDSTIKITDAKAALSADGADSAAPPAVVLPAQPPPSPKRNQLDASSAIVPPTSPNQPCSSASVMKTTTVIKGENKVDEGGSSSKTVGTSGENPSSPSKLPAPQNEQNRFLFVPVTAEERAQSLTHKKVGEVATLLTELLQCAMLHHQTLPRDYRQLIKLYDAVMQQRKQVDRSDDSGDAGGGYGELTVFDRQRILTRLTKEKILQFDYPPNHCMIGLVLAVAKERLQTVTPQVTRAQLATMAVCKQRKHFDAARTVLVVIYQEYIEGVQQRRPSSAVEEEVFDNNNVAADGGPIFMFFSQAYVKFTEAAKKLLPPVQCLTELHTKLFGEMLTKEFADLVEIRYRAEDARLKIDTKAVMAFDAGRNKPVGAGSGNTAKKAPQSIAGGSNKKKRGGVIHSPPSMSGGKISAKTSTTELLKNAARQLAPASYVAGAVVKGALIGLPHSVPVPPPPPPPVAKNQCRVEKAGPSGAASLVRPAHSAARTPSTISECQPHQPATGGEFVLEAEGYKLLPYPLLKDFKLRLCTNLANRPAQSITLLVFHRQFVSMPRRVQLFRINTIETIGRVISRQCNDVVITERAATGDNRNPTYRLQPNWKDIAYCFADDWEESMTNDWDWARRLQQRLFVKLSGQPRLRMTLSALVEYFGSDPKRLAENPIKSVQEMEVILTRYFTDTVMLSRPKTPADSTSNVAVGAAADGDTAAVLLNNARQWPTYNPLEHSFSKFNRKTLEGCGMSSSSSGSSFRTPSVVLSSSSSISQDFAAASFSPPLVVGSLNSNGSITEQELLKCLQEQRLNPPSSTAWKVEEQEQQKFVPFEEIQQQQARHISAESASSTATFIPALPVKTVVAPPPPPLLPSAPAPKPGPRTQQWWHSRLNNHESDFYRRLQQRVYTFLYNEREIQRRRVTLRQLYAMWSSRPSRMEECPFKSPAHMQSILERYFADSFVFKRVVDAGVRAGGDNVNNVVVGILPTARQQQVKRFGGTASSTAINGSSVPEAPKNEPPVVKGLSFAERAYASRVRHANHSNTAPASGATAFDVAGTFQYFDDNASLASSSALSPTAALDDEPKRHWESVFFDAPAINGTASTVKQQQNTVDEGIDDERTPRKPVRAHRRLISGDEELATSNFAAGSKSKSLSQRPMPFVCPTRGPLLDFSDDADVKHSNGAASLFGGPSVLPENSGGNASDLFGLKVIDNVVDNDTVDDVDDEPRLRWSAIGTRPTCQSQVSIDLEKELAERFASIMRDVGC